MSLENPKILKILIPTVAWLKE
ncbi:MAG: hypothetical protein RIS64_4360, partial [Bacteroidota bacterium]